MGWEVAKSAPKVITPELFVELSPEEETIAASLREQGKQTLDDLAKDCGMPVHKLSNLLFQMEMKGVVRPLPGKQFTMCWWANEPMSKSANRQIDKL